MKRTTLALMAIAVTVVVALAEWPCEANQTPLGPIGVTQYKCEDYGYRCTWLPAWNYYHKSQRTCNYWCCQDIYGNIVGNVLTDCGPWAPAGCCAGVNPGWIDNPPSNCIVE